MLRKLKSIFIIEDEKTKTESTSKTPEAQVQSTPAAEADAPVMVEIKDGQVNEKFLNVLLEAMEKNNIPGFDYMEFKQFLKSLDKMEMDEQTKFRSAFATSQTMGATKDNLLSSATRYLDILKAEEQRFELAVKNQRSKLVDDKLAGISGTEKAIAEKEQQIVQITSEIEKLKNDIRQRREEVALAQAKVQQTQSDFQHTYKLLMAQLQEDIRKITNYL